MRGTVMQAANIWPSNKVSQGTLKTVLAACPNTAETFYN